MAAWISTTNWSLARLSGAHSAGEDWQRYCDNVTAAFMLGVAAGQLLHRDVFTKAAQR